MPVQDLQPVVPDPKKLRRTAWILVAIMFVGGFVILKAYEKRTKEATSDKRPSFLTQISQTKDLTFMRQDGKVTDLMSLKGKVLVVQSLSQAQPEELSMAVMKRLAERHAGNEDLVLVTLVLDPGAAESLPAQLAEVAANLGAELPQWVVGSNQKETLHRFIKNEFKANMLPHEKGGKWVYDGSLVLIDRNRHVRRAVVPKVKVDQPDVTSSNQVVAFDFRQAVEWDEKGLITGTDLSNVQRMEELLGETIATVLAEKGNAKERKSPAILVIVGTGFALFFILLILKTKATRNPSKP
jgi:cytochrome oxidase Cu insertion factor (SCO1/SenC/PrrC family)